MNPTVCRTLISVVTLMVPLLCRADLIVATASGSATPTPVTFPSVLTNHVGIRFHGACELRVLRWPFDGGAAHAHVDSENDAGQ